MRLLRYDGRVQSIAAWVIELGLSRSALQNRLNRGWSTKEAFETPVRPPPDQHGAARKGQWSPEYVAWRSMKARCHIKSSSGYYKYGGRGIRVHPLWLKSFSEFFAHVGPKPSPSHSLERKDNTGNYEPGNVRWATVTEQARTRRSTRLLTFEGETLSIAGWAERMKIPYGTLQARVTVL